VLNNAYSQGIIAVDTPMCIV